MQQRHILFDLDGTLSDPTEGIRNSFEYAFNKMHVSFNIDRRFNELIGPPLHTIFSDILGWSREETNQGVEYFREYYGEKGVFENKVYKGIPELLSRLKSKGHLLYVATSKLEKYALQVLEYHSILQYFNRVSGASYKGAGAEKKEIVEKVLAGISGGNELNAVMVGDKKFDMEAAHACGISGIGVLYGFGSEMELSEAGAKSIAVSVEELDRLLNL